MIKREYVVYNITERKKGIAIVCDCANAETLNSFLSTDVIPFEDWIKADFDKVLAGEIDSKTISGNVCSAEIGPVTTKIFDILAEDDEYYDSCCEVNTDELRQLIDDWCDEVRRFKSKYKK